ncbi:hypothetical protein L2E82_01358 [Cichorium intybus]|uniref:Uncharacterized protein n=1 Tax=Cichorium intybus TaxID=13427 RepID=A0ACB9GYQ6_CICIN|nr:hypothetical protein L2E82_01358 [Cichorium intybus]
MSQSYTPMSLIQTSLSDEEDGEIKKRGRKGKDRRSEDDEDDKYKRRRDRNMDDDEDYRKRDGKRDKNSNGCSCSSIYSSFGHSAVGHKLLKIKLEPGQEVNSIDYISFCVFNPKPRSG